MRTLSTLKTSWGDIDKSNIPNDILSLLTKISEVLKENAYVYRLEFSFSELIYENGKLKLPDSISDDEKNKISEDLFTYSNDPLGLILENYIEVHTSHNEEGDDVCIVPLKRINTGELIGTFGTADYLSGQKNGSGSGWSISAGSKYFLPVLPSLFNKDYGRVIQEILGLTYIPGFRRDIKYNLHQHFIDNYSEFTEFKTVIIFFPKQWFENEGHLFSSIREKIWEQCWKQTKDYRLDRTEFNDANELLYKEINIAPSAIPFFQPFPRVIEQLMNGEQLVLKPVDIGTNSILKKLEKRLSLEFENSNHKEVKKFAAKLYEFDYLNGYKNDWGFLSLSLIHFPNQINGERIRNANKKDYFKRILHHLISNGKINEAYFCEPYLRLKKMYQYKAHPIQSLLQHKKEVKHLDYRHFISYLLFKKKAKN